MRSINKKGVAETLVYGVIVLVVALLLIAVLPLIGEAATKDAKIQACRLSFVGAAALKTPVVGNANIDVDCDRLSSTITKDDVYSSNKYDPAKMKRALAENVRECWYMMGSGLRPFDRRLDSSFTHCVVCNEIKIDATLKTLLERQNVMSITGLHDFMQNTPMGPGTYGNPDLTYTEYVLSTLQTTSGLDLVSGKEEAMNYNHNFVTEYSVNTELPIDNLEIIYTYEARGRGNQDYYGLVIIPAVSLGNEFKCGKLWN